MLYFLIWLNNLYAILVYIKGIATSWRMQNLSSAAARLAEASSVSFNWDSAQSVAEPPSSSITNQWRSLSLPVAHSSSGGRLEHDRSLSRQRPQHAGPQRWDQCVTAGDHPVFHLLPAQQAAAHHPPDQCGAVHRVAAQLHGGHLRQVGLWRPRKVRVRFDSIVWPI